jgi:riboflavin-specific deaminase-like protein
MHMDPGESARPFVVLSWAQSADGRIATRTGESKYLSSPESLDIQQELRRDCDAVLIGIGTVLADDPRLLCRLSADRNPSGRQPLRVVLDSRFRTPPASMLARTARESPVLVVGASTVSAGLREAGLRKALEKTGIETATVDAAGTESGAADRGAAEGSRLDLESVLHLLSARGIRSLFVEGGSAILTAFLAADLADLVILDISPRFIGNGIQAVGELGVERLTDARGFRSSGVELRGGNVLWTLERTESGSR